MGSVSFPVLQANPTATVDVLTNKRTPTTVEPVATNVLVAKFARQALVFAQLAKRIVQAHVTICKLAVGIVANVPTLVPQASFVPREPVSYPVHLDRQSVVGFVSTQLPMRKTVESVEPLAKPAKFVPMVLASCLAQQVKQLAVAPVWIQSPMKRIAASVERLAQVEKFALRVLVLVRQDRSFATVFAIT